MANTTHAAVAEASCCHTPHTLTGCKSDVVFVASAIVGAVLGAVVGLFAAAPLVGTEYAEAIGALGAMLGSALLASLTCVPQWSLHAAADRHTEVAASSVDR
jgi:hypothetical protein